MNKALLLAAILCTACGPNESLEVWNIGCLFIKNPSDLIEGGMAFNPSKIERSSLVAQRLIDSRYGPGTFCARASENLIFIRQGPWDCALSPTGCIGEYKSLEGRIDVMPSGLALVHEIIHAQETRQWMIGTVWHEDWDKNGQYDLAGRFEQERNSWN